MLKVQPNRAKLPKGSDAKLKGLKLASESTGCKARIADDEHRNQKSKFE